MNQLTVPSRGAARHWVIGCLAAVVLIVILLGGGGYYLFKQVDPGTFDVTAKADPSLDAPVDNLFPERVGSYERVELTAPDPARGDFLTTGTKAIYQQQGGNRVSVVAIPTEEFQEAQATPRRGAGRAQMSPGRSDVGISVKIPFGPTKGEMAMWSKDNWSYVVQTSNSSALEFAEQFTPSADDSVTTK